MGANPDNRSQRSRRKIPAQTASCTYMYNRSDILVRRQKFLHDVLLELNVARRTKGEGRGDIANVPWGWVKRHMRFFRQLVNWMRFCRIYDINEGHRHWWIGWGVIYRSYWS